MNDEELKQKLRDEVDKASWSMLEAHHKRGALFWVAGIDLAEAGAAVALDDSAKVKLWLDNANLVKVDEEMQKSWSKSPHEKNFQFLIIQPYVFIKALGQ